MWLSKGISSIDLEWPWRSL